MRLAEASGGAHAWRATLASQPPLVAVIINPIIPLPPASVCSVSRQIVMSYHLARRLLPAVEQIMALHQEEVGC